MTRLAQVVVCCPACWRLVHVHAYRVARRDGDGHRLGEFRVGKAIAVHLSSPLGCIAQRR